MNNGLNTNYYNYSRPDLRQLIPTSACKILDVGCGTGNLGLALKAERPYCTVIGVELVPEVAREAEKKLDKVYISIPVMTSK